MSRINIIGVIMLGMFAAVAISAIIYFLWGVMLIELLIAVGVVVWLYIGFYMFLHESED